jgi:hypothetical protein
MANEESLNERWGNLRGVGGVHGYAGCRFGGGRRGGAGCIN